MKFLGAKNTELLFVSEGFLWIDYGFRICGERWVKATPRTFTSFVPHKIRVPYKVVDYLISVVFACASRLLPYNTLFMDLTCQSFFFRVCRSVEIEKRGCSRLWPDIKLSWSSAAFSRISEKLAAWCVPSGEGESVTVHLASPPSPNYPHAMIRLTYNNKFYLFHFSEKISSLLNL